MVFFADDGQVGTELFISNGTSAGTTLLKDLFPGFLLDRSSHPSPFVTAGPIAFFTADDGVHGRELWRTDGRSVALVKDLRLDARDDANAPADLTNAGGRLFFTADDGLTGRELWTSDGTSDGTRLLEIVPGPTGASPRHLTAVGGVLFFVHLPPNGSQLQLWRSDGSAVGTRRVGSISLDPVSLGGMVSDGNRLFIAAGSALLRLEGEQLLQIAALEGSPQGLTFASGRLYFRLRTVKHGLELWTSDGITAGMVRDVDPGSADGSPQIWGGANGWTFFTAHTAGVGFQLWRTDGTEAGTVRLTELANGIERPALLSVLPDEVLFQATQPQTGNELWRSDGTPANTQLVADLTPGPASSTLGPAVTVGAVAYFRGPDGELWRSDGTQPGTALLAEIIPGPGHGSLSNLGSVGRELLFRATDSRGTEPWALTIDPTPPVISAAFTGTAGEAGYFTSDVSVAFSVSDPESPAVRVSGCDPGPRLTSDSRPVSFTCVASSAGGFSRKTVTFGRDTVPPAITCAPGGPYEATGPSGAAVHFPEAEASDATSGVRPISYSPARGSLFPLGNTAVTATARDVAGHSASCGLTVTVQDTTAPSITCPSDLLVDDPGTQAQVVTYPPPVVLDLVDPSPLVEASHPSGSEFPRVITEVTLTAIDASGNRSAPCTFNVTVTCVTEPCEALTGPPRSQYAWTCASSGGGVVLLGLVPLALLLLRRRRVRTATALTTVLLLPFAGQAAEPQRPTLMFMGVSAGTGVEPAAAEDLSEYLQAQLSQAGVYQVTGGNDIATLLGMERQRQLVGCSDEDSSCVAEIAQALNADRAVTGRVSVAGDSVVLSVSLLDVRKSGVVARASRRRDGTRVLEPLYDELEGVAYELVNSDPLRAGASPLVPERRFGGILVGVRGDLEVLGPGVSPSLTVELSNRRLGGAASLLFRGSFGARLEGRFYPFELGRLRPFAALGLTAFGTGIAPRAAVGGALRLGQLHLFADVAYEHFLLSDPRFRPSALLFGGGAGWLF